MNDAIKMQVSAFIDGELPQNEAELLLRRLCQDAELRQQAAEYMAMGRIMRGERRVAGMDKLRGRISAALDDTSPHEDYDVTDTSSPRFLRPLAGVAIAATVALAAILGLQQMSAVPDIDPALGNETVVDTFEDNAYTVPADDNGQLWEYLRIHDASSSHIGAPSINPRILTFPLLEEVNSEAEEQPADEDEVELAETPEAETP